MADRLSGELAPTPTSRTTPRNHDLSKELRSNDGSLTTYDDVIRSLAAMPENRRARQVFKWETIARRSLHSST